MEDRESLRRKPFHPGDPAWGTRGYDIGVHTAEHRQRLSQRRATARRENEVYLKEHPEIKALISILLRHLLRTRPSDRIHEAAGQFFNRPRRQVVLELLNYLSELDCPTESENSLSRRLVRLINDEPSTVDGRACT